MVARKIRIERYRDTRAFLDRATPFLLVAEAQSAMLLGLGARVLDSDCYLAIVEDDSAIVACAVRTPPYGVVVSRAHSAAVDALADDVARKYEMLPSVLGPEPTASAFADAWTRRKGTPSRPFMRMRLFEAREVQHPAAAPTGHLRPAVASDLETLTRWVAAFHEEARTGLPLDPERATRDALEDGRMFVWDDRGLVSLAKGSRRTTRSAGIGLAYTPREHRGRGYASALVAGLTQRLLDEGAAFCCINADVTNPTTNKIYPQIGYRPVCEIANIEFISGDAV